MDRSLDETIAERQSARDDRTNLDNDWVHDRYDDEPDSRRHDRAPRERNYRREDDRPVEHERKPLPAKVKVENLHYDLTEDDIWDLFQRIAPVQDAKLRYDRAGRSEGTAFITYEHVADARAAIREFDGANAKGQPIKITLIPLPRRDNPFDRVENPKSLFDRIEAPASRSRRRSESPMEDLDEERGSRRGARRGGPGRGQPERRSDMTKPAPENIDRYIPGQHDSRSSSHRGGRRPGERRERAPKESDGHRLVGGRPRKTAEELDAEMDDYWGGGPQEGGPANNAAPAQAAVPAGGDDIDMIS